MSKRTKDYEKLLHKKTLSSNEADRLLKIAGWERIRETVGRKKSGTSHMYYRHPISKLETCVPDNRKELSDTVRQVIQKLAGSKGE